MSYYQDLKDDLDALDEALAHLDDELLPVRETPCVAHDVARRVLALYQPCGCGGTGLLRYDIEVTETSGGETTHTGPTRRIEQCHCGGTGIVARADTLGENAVTLTVIEGDTRTFISLDELKRYLFGEGDR